jgi:hypothetical protein
LRKFDPVDGHPSLPFHFYKEHTRSPVEAQEERSKIVATSGIGLVDLCKIPDGLNAGEIETYLRRNGAELCTPRSQPRVADNDGHQAPVQSPEYNPISWQPQA